MRFLFMEESIGYFPNENRDMPLREASFLSKTPWGQLMPEGVGQTKRGISAFGCRTQLRRSE